MSARGNGRRRSESVKTDRNAKDVMRGANRMSSRSKISGNEIPNKLMNRKLTDMAKFMQACTNCINSILTSEKKKIQEIMERTNTTNDQKSIEIEKILSKKSVEKMRLNKNTNQQKQNNAREKRQGRGNSYNNNNNNNNSNNDVELENRNNNSVGRRCNTCYSVKFGTNKMEQEYMNQCLKIIRLANGNVELNLTKENFKKYKTSVLTGQGA